MTRFVLTAGALVSALLLGAPTSGQAQVFKCQQANGTVVYSQSPCGGGAVIPESQLSGNQMQRHSAPAPSETESSVPQRSAARAACLNELEIRNLKVAASSIRHDVYDKQAHTEQIRRGMACEPLMTPDQVRELAKTLRLERGRGRGAIPDQPAPPPPPAMPDVITSCNDQGCWGSDGSRYHRAANGSFWGTDGKNCRMVRNEMRCN